MKFKYILSTVAVGGMLYLSSCDVLNQDPELEISDESAFTNENSANAALAGLYHQLQAGAYYGRNFQIIADVSADVSQSVGTWDFYREMDTYQLDASNLELTNFYTAAYRAVNQANNIIAEVPNIEMAASRRDNIIGQAHLVRGLAFFDLNRVFGGVPGVIGELSVVLPLTPSRGVGESLFPSRPSLMDGYNQVKADLELALQLLPEEQSSNSFTRSRAVKATARALLARLHLYMGNFPQAASFASDVISDGKYSLVSNYLNIFSTDFSSESIFELDFIAADQSGLRFWYFPGAQGGRGELAVNNDFLASIKANPDDIRGTMFGFDPIQNVSFPTKYQKPGNIDNAHLIRIAEMYLIRAEALARTGNVSAAVADVNKIRNRAGVADYSGAMTAEAVLLEIEKQRRFELAFEGHTFFDLVRTNRALTVLSSVNRVNSSAPVSLDQPWKQILPIPRDELLSNPNMVQNPNYGN
ncbi:RagB/SusD domain-containing protein [Nitritalea halalkaliphila LW7]|uniref:RagB/SusD domain-containing protein n=1 Tax=Nitritalea halalkaliphila LW7 TaxID=1189621 RepID=I5CA34_9BACT|nr:RagB/SusD family nutrient uptake outer membrane protein [Nitritalea halalkaliphila]EIM78686.1 RagB/SusD domain-containing protein [Nitritalea halalkaliphila LW7]